MVAVDARFRVGVSDVEVSPLVCLSLLYFLQLTLFCRTVACPSSCFSIPFLTFVSIVRFCFFRSSLVGRLISFELGVLASTDCTLS